MPQIQLTLTQLVEMVAALNLVRDETGKSLNLLLEQISTSEIPALLMQPPVKAEDGVNNENDPISFDSDNDSSDSEDKNNQKILPSLFFRLVRCFLLSSENSKHIFAKFISKLKKMLDVAETSVKEAAMKYLHHDIKTSLMSIDMLFHKEIFIQFIYFIGVEKLEQAIRENYRINSFFNDTILSLISPSFLNEILQNPNRNKFFNYNSRNSILIALTSVNEITMSALFSDDTFLKNAITYLNPEEIKELILNKLSTEKLAQLFFPNVTENLFKQLYKKSLRSRNYFLFSKSQKESEEDNNRLYQSLCIYIIERLSPFKLRELLKNLISENTYIDNHGFFPKKAMHDTFQYIHIKYKQIKSFIKDPEKSLKNHQEDFLAYLAIHLNKDNVDLGDAKAWLDLLTITQKKCKDRNITSKLNLYIWKIQKTLSVSENITAPAYELNPLTLSAPTDASNTLNQERMRI